MIAFDYRKIYIIPGRTVLSGVVSFVMLGWQTLCMHIFCMMRTDAPINATNVRTYNNSGAPAQ